MLTVTIVTLLFCFMLFSPGHHCYSQHMCDIETWVADNDMPINKLDVSTPSKAKLVRSIRSTDKLIKCSELRLIHKEAELDRPFRQNRYKVSAKRAKESLERPARSGDREPERHFDGDDRGGYDSRGDEESHDDHDRRRARSEDNADSEKLSTVERQRTLPDPAVASQQEQTSTSDSLQEQTTAPTPDGATSSANTTADTPVGSDKQEFGSGIRLQQDGLNGTTNGTTSGSELLLQPNGTANATVANRTTNSQDWLLPCYTCPMALNLTRSWQLCRILPSGRERVTAEATVRPESTVRASLPLSVLCGRSVPEYRNKSVYLCETLLRVGPKLANVSRPLDNSSNVGIDASHEGPTNPSRPSSDHIAFVLECLQCPVAPPDLHLWNNTTRSFCVFAIATNRKSHDGPPPPPESQQQHILADKLQFIDETAASAAAIAAANEAHKAGGGVGDLMGGGEQPTRIRHEDRKQPHQQQPVNETAESERQQHNQSSDDAGVVKAPPADAATNATTTAETLAQQVEALSHSAFMEKLFEALLRKRKRNFTSPTDSDSDAPLDSLNGRLTNLANLTAQKSNRSELHAMEARLKEMEARLVKKLALMEHRNRRLLDQMRKIEVLTSVKLSACQSQLSLTNASLQLVARRHERQLATVERRLAQMSQRVRSAEHRWNRTLQLLPAVPPMFQQQPQPQQQVADGGASLQHSESHAASAALPSVNGKSLLDDCSDIYARMPSRPRVDDGAFLANLGLAAPVKVRCDLKNSGWTYILSRSDGRVDFFRNWTSYRAGFGDPPGEHFVGLDALAEMTSRRHYQLQVVLEDWEGSVKSVNYGQFQVLGERHNFQLQVDHFAGDPAVGDALSSHSNASFSTFDSDNDLVESKFGGNCARRFRGGFWYFSCYRANPTGRYYSDGGRIPDKRCDGIVWKPWKGPHYSLRSIHMKVKPRTR